MPLSLLIILFLFGYACISLQELYPTYLDVDLCYILAGLEYLRTGNIDLINWEHPPLAKYIMGLAYYYLGDYKVISLLFSYYFLYGFYNFVNLYVNDREESIIILSSLCFIPLFLAVSISSLPDVYMNAFLIWGLYLVLKNINNENIDGLKIALNYVVGGFLLGFAFSCKWPAIYVIGGLLIGLLISSWKGNFRNILKIICLIMTAFIASYLFIYIPYFLRGRSIVDFLFLQKKMILFHLERHKFAFYRAFNGITRFFFNFIILKSVYLGHYSFILTTINGTPSIITSFSNNAGFQGVKMVFFLGCGWFVSFLFLPSLITTAYNLLYRSIKLRELDYSRFALFTIALCSMVNFLPGFIDWYIYNSMIFMIILVYNHVKEYMKMDIKMLLLLTMLNLMFFVLGFDHIEFILR